MIMSQNNADVLLSEGEAALNNTKYIFVSSLFGKSQSYQNAAESFAKAGNAFKLNNQWKSAGDAFIRSSEAWKLAGEEPDVINMLVEAGNCYKRINPADTVRSFRRAIGLYNEKGQFGMSARYLKEIAEILETEGNDIKATIEAYEQAAAMFDRDNKKSNANTCFLKLALLLSEKAKEFSKAAKIFEDLAKKGPSSSVSASFAARGYFFQALLCILALGDVVQVQRKLEEYKNFDFSFGSSRECDFVTKLVDAVERYDADEFSQICADFDRITPLDPWKTSMLLKAKHFISEVAGGDEPDLS